MYLYLSVVLALHNKALLSVGTSLHVAAYGVISYSEAFFYLIFEDRHGHPAHRQLQCRAGNWSRVLRVRNLALGVTMAVALCGMIPLYLWPGQWFICLRGQCCPVAGGDPRYLALLLGLPMEGLLLVGPPTSRPSTGPASLPSSPAASWC